MINKYAKFSTCLFFIVIGIFIGLIFSANANRTNTSLPIDELRNFTEIFGKIKNDYVEDVTDKKLISEAIKGMLSGLDPHSAYLDEDAFKDLQVVRHPLIQLISCQASPHIVSICRIVTFFKQHRRSSLA